MSLPALNHRAGELPADRDGERAGRVEVQEVVRGFAKALRTHLLYQGNSPALDRFVDTLRTRMSGLWEHMTSLSVLVEERDIRWHGQSVLHSEERESLPFLLFKDGVRELTFFRGFEDDDLEAFLDLLARVQRLRSDEEDLLTLLWDHDWQHFRYRYVEPLAEGVEPPHGSDAPPQRVEPPREEEAEVVSTVSREDFREALYFLDEGELRRLEADLAREMKRDLWQDVINALLDRLEDGPADRQERVVEILGDVLPMLLGGGRLGMAAHLLRELVGAATGGRRMAPPAVRGLRAIFEQLATAESVAELVRTLEEGGVAVETAALPDLLEFYPPESLGPLLRASEVSGSAQARTALRAAAQRLASANPAQLRTLVTSEDPHLAAAAARLLGKLRIAEAAPDLVRLLRQPNAAVRLAAVEAVQDMRSPTGVAALDPLLEDADRDVRVATARALAALRWAPARKRMEEVMESKRLREAELTERIAFFESYGALAGIEGVPLLERVLNGKNWLGRRESGEMRACAALGLGRVQHPSAERALATAAADPDPVVRSAVSRAIRALRA
jgi:HEAT repeat protein